MDATDLIIGATLMNAMPHFVLGIWQGRMFSAFGFGNRKNIAYALLNFALSAGLFIYKYGMEGLLHNGIYLGALTLLLIYFFTGQFWYTQFHRKHYTERA